MAWGNVILHFYWQHPETQLSSIHVVFFHRHFENSPLCFLLKSLSWRVTKVFSMCTIYLIQCQCKKSRLYWWFVLWIRRYSKVLLQRKDWFNSMKTVELPHVGLSELGHCNPWLFKPSQTPASFRRALNVHRSVYPSAESTHISFPRELLFLLMISAMLSPEWLLQGEIQRLYSIFNSALFQWPWYILVPVCAAQSSTVKTVQQKYFGILPEETWWWLIVHPEQFFFTVLYLDQ